MITIPIFQSTGIWFKVSPTLFSLISVLEKTGFEIVKIKGEESSDYLSFGLGSMKDNILKRIITKVYNLGILEYTSFGIHRADRLIILAKKRGDE